MAKRKDEQETVSEVLVGAEIIKVEIAVSDEWLILYRADGAKIKIRATGPGSESYIVCEISRPGEYRELIAE